MIPLGSFNSFFLFFFLILFNADFYREDEKTIARAFRESGVDPLMVPRAPRAAGVCTCRATVSIPAARAHEILIERGNRTNENECMGIHSTREYTEGPRMHIRASGNRAYDYPPVPPGRSVRNLSPDSISYSVVERLAEWQSPYGGIGKTLRKSKTMIERIRYSFYRKIARTPVNLWREKIKKNPHASEPLQTVFASRSDSA